MLNQTRLSNGLELLTVPMQGTKTITILVMVGTGSKHESRDNNGISHFLEHMFFKGTEKRPNALVLTSEIDSLGAEFNAFTTKEYTGYWVKVDSSKQEKAIEILSDMLLNSKFDEDEIDKERGVIIEEMNMYHENPMMYIEDVFEECLYGDTPAGWEIIGTKDNINRFKRNDFIKYIESQYSINSIKICLAGNINDETVDLVQKYFTPLKKADFIDKEKVNESQVEPNIFIKYKKTNQANISLGVRTFQIEHEDEFAMRLLSILLGGSMSARLFIELREKRGLAYYVRTQGEFYSDSGYITTQAGIPSEKIEEAISVIIEAYKKTIDEPVKEEELQKIKDLIQGRTVIQLESSDSMANWYTKQALLRKSIFSPEEYFEKVNKVSKEDIQRVAQKYFVNNGLNLAVIGPYDSTDKFRKLLVM